MFEIDEIILKYTLDRARDYVKDELRKRHYLSDEWFDLMVEWDRYNKIVDELFEHYKETGFEFWDAKHLEMDEKKYPRYI